MLTGTETEPASPKETIRTPKPHLARDKDISVAPKIKARKCNRIVQNRTDLFFLQGLFKDDLFATIDSA